MKPMTTTLSGLALVLAASVLASEQAGWKSFGAAFTLQEAVPLAEVLAEPAAHVGKTVRVEGKVADVCRNKGCWMVLAEGDRNVRVTMKGYGFFVDTDSSGALADLEGTLVEKPVDPEAEAHYAAEASNPEAVVKSPGATSYEFVADAIRIKK